MRTRMYGFAQANADRIYSAESLATVGVYHSSGSRDFADPTEGTGQYATTTRPAGVRDWWSTEATDSCYAKQWLGEFRGTVKALVHAHVPFNVVTSPGLRAEDLTGYKVLVLPDLEAVADAEVAAIRQFVQGGGVIVITGANPTGMNEFGDSRPEFALSDVLGITRDTRPQALKQNTFGSGTAYYLPDLPGRRYLAGNAGDAFEALIAPVRQHAQAAVTAEAERQVHVEAYRFDKDVVVQLTNFIGVTGGAMSVVPTTARVSVQLPASARLKSVGVSSPDDPTPELQPLQVTTSGNTVSFAVPLQQYALVVVSTE
jgi:hypothetical protein